MGYTEKLSTEQLCFKGMVTAISAATGSSLVTEAIPLADGRRTLFTLCAGAFAASGSAQILVGGATASGATFTTITSLTSTAVTASGAAQSEATAESIVGLASGFTWLKGYISISGGSATGALCLQVYQDAARYRPQGSQPTYLVAATVF
jgi:hypothetical protein